MSVFLRWGILGILSVAALVYVYNASKRLSEKRDATPAAASASERSEGRNTAARDVAGSPEDGSSADTPAGGPSADCAEELRVARLAREMRGEGEPLDRLLRSQEIAWQESDARRERLEAVARRWFERDYPIGPEELRASVLRECEPAP